MAGAVRLIKIQVAKTMICALCKKGSTDMTTECGHHYHAACFQARWTDCHLPCFVCARPLGHAVEDVLTKDWCVGVHGGTHWCACYRVTANESKIVRSNKGVPRWQRTNGRLHSQDIFPLCFNICVS